uniref:F-box domain-containing protein n=1 Tax=Panagrellus redivivus TaxID=6233 RepID=A0A7E4VUS6_PANRE
MDFLALPDVVQRHFLEQCSSLTCLRLAKLFDYNLLGQYAKAELKRRPKLVHQTQLLSINFEIDSNLVYIDADATSTELEDEFDEEINIVKLNAHLELFFPASKLRICSHDKCEMPGLVLLHFQFCFEYLSELTLESTFLNKQDYLSTLKAATNVHIVKLINCEFDSFVNFDAEVLPFLGKMQTIVLKNNQNLTILPSTLTALVAANRRFKKIYIDSLDGTPKKSDFDELADATTKELRIYYRTTENHTTTLENVNITSTNPDYCLVLMQKEHVDY